MVFTYKPGDTSLSSHLYLFKDEYSGWRCLWLTEILNSRGILKFFSDLVVLLLKR